MGYLSLIRLGQRLRLHGRKYALDLGLLLVATLAAVALPWPWAVLCVVAPLCEEIIFRWGLQEGLLRRGLPPWQANALTALVFAGAHAFLRSWTLGAGVLLPALFLGWVFQRTRSQGALSAVRACVLWHAAFNVIYVCFVRQVLDAGLVMTGF